MNFMQLYSGMFLTTTIILGIALVICLILMIGIVSRHVCYKRELNLSVALRKEVEAQLAVSLEVENFYFVLFLDFVTTRDQTTLAYKAAMIRTIIDILSFDESFLPRIKKAMIRPGGTASILKQILEPNLSVVEDDTKSAYERFIENIKAMETVCTTKCEESRDARNRAGAMSDLTHIPASVQAVGERNISEVNTEGTVQLIYDAETAKLLQQLKHEADVAAMAQAEESEDEDADE